MGHQNSSYIDDVILIGDTFEECKNNVIETVNMSLNLGFVVHPSESVFEPTQKIVFLGFILDSKDMTISLTHERATKLKDLCTDVF